MTISKQNVVIFLEISRLNEKNLLFLGGTLKSHKKDEETCLTSGIKTGIIAKRS